MDRPASLFLTLILAVAAWFVLRWLIVALWSYRDTRIGAFQEHNRANEQGTPEEIGPKQDSEPIRKEWEEQGISFQEWLDYSDAYRTPRGEDIPPDSHYEQFKSYKPPDPLARKNKPDPIRNRIDGSSSSHPAAMRQTPVLHPLSGPTTSTLVSKFLTADIHLFHFTDAANLESIQKLGGLFPRAELQEQMPNVRFLSSDGSRIADDRKGLSRFVHLAFHEDNSMLTAVRYRTWHDVVLYQVSLLVLDREGCCFTRSFAHSHDAVRIPIADITSADLAAISRSDEETKKWQLLVPGKIPCAQIREYSRLKGLGQQWQRDQYSWRQ